MPAHITRVQVIRFESPGRDLERTSHPSSCFLMPKHSAQRFSGARSPSISAIRLVPMNCVTLQPYACPNRSCAGRTSRARAVRVHASRLPAQQCVGGEKRPGPQNAGRDLSSPARARACPVARPALLKSCNKRPVRTGNSKNRAQTSTWRRQHAPQRPLSSQAARDRPNLTSWAAASAHPGQLPAVGAARARSPGHRRPRLEGPGRENRAAG
jgi:hypothetical protein